jgi:trigger factor
VLENLSFPAPGFSEQLIGMKADEEKSFSLTYPEDFSSKELAGKEAQFKVKVKEIKQEKLPELNDEFAKTVNPEYENIGALRAKIEEDLKSEMDNRNRRDFEERAIQAVADITTLEFPPIMVEAEVNQLIEEQMSRWQMSGNQLEDYLKIINKTEEELREELRPVATKRVTQSLVLGKIAEEEKIEVTDKEIDEEIEKMAEGSNYENKDELRNFLATPQSRYSVERILLTQKTVGCLTKIAKGETEE